MSPRFDKGLSSYLSRAFPGDELRPISGTPAFSFAELGLIQPEEEGYDKSDGHHKQCHDDNAAEEEAYRGVGLTLIDALPTIALLGNETAFLQACCMVVEHLDRRHLHHHHHHHDDDDDDDQRRGFDLDVTVNVFEATIRALGGLVSAAWIAKKKSQEVMMEEEQQGGGQQHQQEIGEQGNQEGSAMQCNPIQFDLVESRLDPALPTSRSVLSSLACVRPGLHCSSVSSSPSAYYHPIALGLERLALDLGERLLPAFAESPTGVPFPWINLRHGVGFGDQFGEGEEATTSGRTTTTTLASTGLLIEFGMLSRLTGNATFEARSLKCDSNNENSRTCYIGLGWGKTWRVKERKKEREREREKTNKAMSPSLLSALDWLID